MNKWKDSAKYKFPWFRCHSFLSPLSKALEGEIPKEKLWTEVFAPYKQNWIGVFSVFIVVLATLVTKFPELLNTPVIQIPDL
jgi:hypothetical protein